MTEAYPLSWPEGWARTAPHLVRDSKYQFARPKRDGSWGRDFWTFAAARDALYDELRMLGATPGRTVLSTNFPLNSHGEPHDRRRRPDDQGVAVYFELDGRAMVMACDLHVRAEENMRSLALSIAALRTLDRHGGGIMRERAFTGFEALPPPGGAESAKWWRVLRVEPDASAAEIEAAFRQRAQEAHPDKGGSDAAMAEVNGARRAGLQAAALSQGEDG